MHLHPIIAARGHARPHALAPTPALTNPALFARDQQLCLYCGNAYPRSTLTRDHVQPVSKGGRDIWENVVTACYHCNSRKGNRTPQQAGMPLLAVPFRPSWIEHLILSNRNILADQMAFLNAQLPKKTRLFRVSVAPRIPAACAGVWSVHDPPARNAGTCWLDARAGWQHSAFPSGIGHGPDPRHHRHGPQQEPRCKRRSRRERRDRQQVDAGAGDGADFVVIDMDSLYGPMSWLAGCTPPAAR
jgi:hypothetical protein